MARQPITLLPVSFTTYLRGPPRKPLNLQNERFDNAGSSHRNDVLCSRLLRSSLTVFGSLWILCSSTVYSPHLSTATVAITAPSSCRKLAPRHSHLLAANCLIIGCYRSCGHQIQSQLRGTALGGPWRATQIGR